MFFGGSNTPSKAPPRGPESTPGARKRGPRTPQIKNGSKRQMCFAPVRGGCSLRVSTASTLYSPILKSVSLRLESCLALGRCPILIEIVLQGGFCRQKHATETHTLK